MMMRRFIEASMTGVLVIAASAAVSAQSDAAAVAQKAAVIGQLLEVTHAADQVLDTMEAGLPAVRAANPGIPAIFWDRFVQQARARRNELLATLVPVYARTFELSELEELLRFYNTPLGRRLLEVQPTIARESMESGQVWGARIGLEVGQQLQREGVRLEP